MEVEGGICGNKQKSEEGPVEQVLPALLWPLLLLYLVAHAGHSRCVYVFAAAYWTYIAAMRKRIIYSSSLPYPIGPLSSAASFNGNKIKRDFFSLPLWSLFRKENRHFSSVDTFLLLLFFEKDKFGTFWPFSCAGFNCTCATSPFLKCKDGC